MNEQSENIGHEIKNPSHDLNSDENFHSKLEKEISIDNTQDDQNEDMFNSINMSDTENGGNKEEEIREDIDKDSSLQKTFQYHLLLPIVISSFSILILYYVQEWPFIGYLYHPLVFFFLGWISFYVQYKMKNVKKLKNN